MIRYVFQRESKDTYSGMNSSLIELDDLRYMKDIKVNLQFSEI